MADVFGKGKWNYPRRTPGWWLPTSVMSAGVAGSFIRSTSPTCQSEPSSLPSTHNTSPPDQLLRDGQLLPNAPAPPIPHYWAIILGSLQTKHLGVWGMCIQGHSASSQRTPSASQSQDRPGNQLIETCLLSSSLRLRGVWGRRPK
jgi:hypothetical protein